MAGNLTPLTGDTEGSTPMNRLVHAPSRQRRRSSIAFPSLAAVVVAATFSVPAPAAAAAFVIAPSASVLSKSQHAPNRPSRSNALLLYADENNSAAGPGTGTGAESVSGFGPPSQRYLDELGHPIEEKKIDYVGAGTLGDIMSSSSEERVPPDKDDSAAAPFTTATKEGANAAGAAAMAMDEGLVTTAGGTLRSRFGSKVSNLSPLDRIALTANGNLQRIVSSYYDAPVHVHVDRCEMREDEDDATANGDDLGYANGDLLPQSPNCSAAISNGIFDLSLDGGTGAASKPKAAVWDRKVHLSVHSHRFCTATSVVTVHSAECIRLVHSGQVGIGQLFRHLDKLPTFALLDAGRTDGGELWRSYTLRCDELTCVIREEFVKDAWGIVPDVGDDEYE